jgi:ArsR family transcriptional regulator, arsenate/arsenite/antimonite-responsive transcriptional repressor
MIDPVTVLSALAEPTRLAAVQLLSDGSEHCVCELMRKLDASQSRMSRHMAVLKSAGLVMDRRDAQWVRYKLNPHMPQAVATIIAGALAVSRDTQRSAA